MKKNKWPVLCGPKSFNIPACILHDLELRPTDAIVYGAINWVHDKKGFCDATNSVMSSISGLSNRAVRASIGRLTKRNYVKVKMVDFRMRIVCPLEINHGKEIWPTCIYCGEGDISLLEYDHIIPRAKGGTNKSSNMDLVCLTCNRNKRTKSKEDFIKQNIIWRQQAQTILGTKRR